VQNRRMRSFFGILFALSSSAPALAANPQFELMLEDGSQRTFCEVKRRPSGGPDWRVWCGEKEYAVHLVFNKFPTASGQVRLQILYWVLDYNNRPDSSLAGTHHGTNLEVLVPSNLPTPTFQLGQVVDTNWNLNVTIGLEPQFFSEARQTDREDRSL